MPTLDCATTRKTTALYRKKLTWTLENRFELFLLDEGQQKVEEKAETRKSKLQNTLSPRLGLANQPYDTKQASRTRPSSPSTRRTTRSATCSRLASKRTPPSYSRPTKYPTRSSLPLNSASKPTARLHRRRRLSGPAPRSSPSCPNSTTASRPSGLESALSVRARPSDCRGSKTTFKLGGAVRIDMTCEGHTHGNGVYGYGMQGAFVKRWLT